MSRAEPTREELERVKDHFEAQGYGRVSDETAAAQSGVIRMIRRGRSDELLGARDGQS